MNGFDNNTFANMNLTWTAPTATYYSAASL